MDTARNEIERLAYLEWTEAPKSYYPTWFDMWQAACAWQRDNPPEGYQFVPTEWGSDD